MYLTNDNLKTMAASAVALFKNSGIPLNDSIAKVAIENEMNSDQVMRLVETTNQIAYLSELSTQEDRTFEFPVAVYDDIMSNIVDVSLEKTASYASDPMDIISGIFSTPMVKEASQEKVSELTKLGRNDKLKALKKVASQERNRLDEMSFAEHDNLVKMAQYKALVLRDSDALLKMASFDNGKDMAKVVFGHTKVASEVRTLWDPEEVATLTELSNHIQMCKKAMYERKDLESKVLKAEGILKEAFVSAALNAARSATGALKGGYGKAAAGASALGAATGGKLKKAYGAFETVDSTNQVRKKAKGHSVWSSLRG